ncbi:peptide-methionine (S)-S-oxide reductase [Aeromonas bestiarum]|uniref:peptide-methionine (S)-S-oxide reductase n=1 Tax=Aeromonas bestiarum TaxID=105751 RepID=UPI002379994D|nr:peptide-methionine (S)-S-oxide reductase [Aeromonas bestiarum]WDL81246.1 peptide-methionine (S)-S-oxide reductase [Aeromonas bestiarum]
MTDNVSKFISILLLFPSASLWADTAVLAAGDMWRAEIVYEAVPGVTRVEPGYVIPLPEGTAPAQGAARRQAVRIDYDPALVGYGDLLNVFWQLVDGHDGGGQYCNRGQEFVPALLPRDDYQWRLAQVSLTRWQALHGRASRVSLWPDSRFTPAPEMEDWAQRHPWRFGFYARRCGGWPVTLTPEP